MKIRPNRLGFVLCLANSFIKLRIISTPKLLDKNQTVADKCYLFHTHDLLPQTRNALITFRDLKTWCVAQEGFFFHRLFKCLEFRKIFFLIKVFSFISYLLCIVVYVCCSPKIISHLWQQNCLHCKLG